MGLGGTRVERVRERPHDRAVLERDVRLGRMGGQDAIHVVSWSLYSVDLDYACRFVTRMDRAKRYRIRCAS